MSKLFGSHANKAQESINFPHSPKRGFLQVWNTLKHRKTKHGSESGDINNVRLILAQMFLEKFLLCSAFIVRVKVVQRPSQSSAPAVICLVPWGVQTSRQRLGDAEPFNALFSVFRLPFLPGLLEGELLSCFCSAFNFLTVFCSSYFPSSDQEEVCRRSFSRTLFFGSFNLTVLRFLALLSSLFLPPPLFFFDPTAAQVGFYVTLREPSSLERPHVKTEWGEWVGNRGRERKSVT